MLQRWIQNYTDSFHTLNQGWTLELHANNFAGKNKTGFVHMYLCWRVSLIELILRYMISGHTVIIVEASFRQTTHRLEIYGVRTASKFWKSSKNY